MPTAPPSNKIIVADHEFDIDWPTYTFKDEDPGYNAYVQGCTKHANGACGPGGMPREPAKGIQKLTRYRPRRLSERSLAAAQAVVKQFVIHLDGCAGSEMCFDVLHNERGLSCHFIIDNDGTIYQTLDLADCAYHACGLNETSIGVEFCNRGDAKRFPDFYEKRGEAAERPVVMCEVNREKYAAFEFTPRQYEGMQHLVKVLAVALPNIKQEYPTDASGNFLWNVIYEDKEDPGNLILREKFAGYLGHFHVTNQKWDPGPFDFNKLFGKAARSRAFPIGLKDFDFKTEVPTDSDALKKATELYYQNNEMGAGGFFPVGPFEGNRLYHNGVHLHGAAGDDVVAPFAGKIVLARNIPENGAIGSVNFVLIKHSIKIGRDQLEFYSLYMHLKPETRGLKPDKRPLKWMQDKLWDDGDTTTQLAILMPGIPVEPGEVIGHIGQAGPDHQPQLHFEIVAVDNGPETKLDKEQFWNLVPGDTDRRFCTQKPILDLLDTGKKDGELSDEEITDFYHDNPEKESMRHVITRDYSEWSYNPPWDQVLKDPKAEPKFRKLKPKEVQDLIDEQITPTLWWTEAVQSALHLPEDSLVYHYHPISFVLWLNKHMGSADGGTGVTKATAADIAAATGTAKMDLDDKEGTSFVSEDDLKEVSEADKPRLEDLIDGYGD
jgi:N-acetyl-anhydromuramyl-L-alanine amidase AmpD/murein DD-endopeptidase MepM/ murein hydrolase activator NlpD